MGRQSRRRIRSEPRTATPTVAATSLTPAVIAYGVGPLALVVLLIFRHFGLVARAPVWAYVTALFGSGIASRLVERWRNSEPGSLQLHVRVVVHVVAVTAVIYLSGWGPALGMAYTFSALADMEQSGAKAWRAALGWSVVGCAVGPDAHLDRVGTDADDAFAGRDDRRPRRVRVRDRDPHGRRRR